jgi:hypothetical protein
LSARKGQTTTENIRRNKRFSRESDSANDQANNHSHDTEDSRHSVPAHSPSTLTNTVDMAENVHVQSENSSSNDGNSDDGGPAIGGSQSENARASVDLQRRAKTNQRDLLHPSRIGKAYSGRQKLKMCRRKDKPSIPFTSSSSSRLSGTKAAGI